MKPTFKISSPFLTRPPVVTIENLPDGMRGLVGQAMRLQDQEKIVRFFYDELLKKYKGYRLLTFIRLDRFLINDLDTLWGINGFLHCNHLNYLMYTLLLSTNRFFSDDIDIIWTQIWLISPHQYLKVHLLNKDLDIDLWGNIYGVPFGGYAHGFQSGRMLSSIK